jgi:hypothetical protein
MATIGINLSLDVTKLDKTRFFQGKKGTYADITVFIDTDQLDDYGNHGSLKQSTTKDERDGGMKMPFCGSAKVFHAKGIQVNFGAAPQQANNGQNFQQAPQQQPINNMANTAPPSVDDFDNEDIPF